MTSQAQQHIPRPASDRLASSAALGASGCEQGSAELVGRVLQAMNAERALTDRELRQHAMDCGYLMEDAYAKFLETGEPAHREAAVAWLARRNEALKGLQARRTGLCEGSAWFASDEAQQMGRRKVA